MSLLVLASAAETNLFCAWYRSNTSSLISYRMSEVIRDVSFISKLLKNEFVYGTEGLEANIDSTISSLQQDGVILLEDGYVGLSPAERARGRNNFDFYNFLIWPFIEGKIHFAYEICLYTNHSYT